MVPSPPSNVRLTRALHPLRRQLDALRAKESFWPLTVVTLCIVVVNLPTLFHLVSTNPVQLYANLSLGPTHQFLTGTPIIDPNAGYVTQALGHLASTSWLHGHVPWWNPYEGIGTPLAGEMQSAAFFPFTLLLYSTWGFVLFHLCLELIAGWATYFLVRRLGVGRTAATAAAVAFGLCGTFAWFAHAPANPVAFLPLSLLGVERALARTKARRPGGWVLLAIALALSVVAGFPEVAYLDGLLIVLWTVIRLFTMGSHRLAFVTKLVKAGVVAAMLSAPVLVAFVTYLPHADVGGHSGAFGNAALVPQALPQLLLPYVYGPIFALNSTGTTNLFDLIWGNVGGYLTAASVALALVGLTGRHLRSLRLSLGAWTAVALAKTYGLQPFARIVTHFPGLHSTATYRYSPPSWELSVIVLAALGIDDIRRRDTRAAIVIAGGATTIALAAWSLAAAWPVLSASKGSSHPHGYALISFAWAVLTAALVTGSALVALHHGDRARHSHSTRAVRWASYVLPGVIVIDAMVMFGAPLLSAPRPQPVDLAVVKFLQNHLGPYRFATLGAIQPNFGTYFGIAEVNINDVPIPKSYRNYIGNKLNDNVYPLTFTGTVTSDPTAPSNGEELTSHFASYEAISVKYVLVPASGVDSSGQPWPPPQYANLPMPYHDSLVRVYQLPDPASTFSTVGNACSVSELSWDSASIRCTHRTTLVRRELWLPGWSATSGTHVLTVRSYQGLFQKVTVPAGDSVIQFTFSPPHSQPALVACLLALCLIVIVTAWNRRKAVPQPINGGPAR